MNEAHYTSVEHCPTHSRFWRNHQQFRLPGRLNLNYLEPAVREYFLGLIFELLERYDMDGFECDFMRHPSYIPADKLEEGTEVMTGVVRAIRSKLDDLSKRRGKRLVLGVRVPRSPELAGEIGLDIVVRRWPRGHDNRLLLFSPVARTCH